jgi:hypothetical protein
MELHRKARIVAGGGEVYVLDDGEGLSPNAIIGSAGDVVQWAYLCSPQQPERLFGNDPEGACAKHDTFLGASRSKELAGSNLVIRRTTIVGTVRRGETLTWSRPPGTLRVGVMLRGQGNAAFWYLGEWMKVEAGKRYRVVYEVSLSGGSEVFTVEELK